MKKPSKNSIINISVIFFIFVALCFFEPVIVRAQTTPDLGAATTYGILGGTYTDTTAGTIITNGDVGYTTPPATPPTMIGGTIYGAGAPTPQARIDATTALTTLNALTCPPANNLGVAVDLSLVHGALYTPGVYCTTGAMSIGTGGITLDGAGTYVFRANGTFNTAVDSVITLTGGASACDVFWTPTGATTLGANTVLTNSFSGTIIDNNNFITVGINVGWLGRALSLLAGTVTTDTDSITVPTCAAPQLTVAKVVTNNNGGTLADTAFPLFIDGSSVTNGIASTTSAGVHTVSETYDSAAYVQTFSVNCPGGNISLASGDVETCTITNDDIAPSLTLNKIVDNTGGGTALESDWTLTATGSSTISGPGASGSADVVSTSTFKAGTYILSETGSVANYSASVWSCTGTTLTGNSITLGLGDTAVCTITNTYTAPAVNSSSGSSPSVIRPAIKVTKVVNPSVLAGPGLVLYTYTLRNTGTISVSDVTMVDDTCESVNLISGDTDLDAKLDVNETWIYQCNRILSNTTTNTVVATGQANGLSVTDTADATVVVGEAIAQETIVPGLPNTGLNTDWIIGILSGLLVIALITLASILKKRIM